jgi:putative ABC transport system substrate-binding protein
VAWPRAAEAQQRALPVIGFLNTRGPADDAHLMAAFRQGLAGMGYVEGSNVRIEYRWAEGRNERLPELVADLIRRQVSVIAANSQATMAAKAATSTIPIVFITGADPVQVGFVKSLRRPGGNLTGVTSLDTELGGKRLQMLHELLPDAHTIAALINPTFPGSDIQTTDLQAASNAFGLRLHVLHASTAAELDAVFETAARLQADGLVIANDPFFNSWLERLGALAFRHRLPAIYEFRPFVAAGGLMSYGGDITELYRIFGTYAGQILKGEKPADLPVQQATKVELIINLKAAKALGITFPTGLLVRADEVIE